MAKHNRKIVIPKGISEDQEADFWSNIDLTEHLDVGDLQNIEFPKLKLTSVPISIRVPKYLLIRIKEQAQLVNAPYQSLMKQYLAEGVIRKDERQFFVKVGSNIEDITRSSDVYPTRLCIRKPFTQLISGDEDVIIKYEDESKVAHHQ